MDTGMDINNINRKHKYALDACICKISNMQSHPPNPNLVFMFCIFRLLIILILMFMPCFSYPSVHYLLVFLVFGRIHFQVSLHLGEKVRFMQLNSLGRLDMP